MKIENIKFKAKQLNSGKWFEGDLVRIGNRVCIGGDHIKDGITDVDPYTVCQFTGLKDRKGNEIWEDDRMRSPRLGTVVTVEWDDYSCGYKCVDYIGNINYSLISIKLSGWYVIGNKFDKEK